MNKLEFYKNMYYWELDIKEKINSRISIPLTVATLLIGGLGYFYKNIIKFPDKACYGVYLIVLSIYTIAVIATVVYTLLAYFKYTYKYVSADYILEFDINIKKYYDDNYEDYFKKDGVEKEKLVERDFEEKLISKYVEATKWNMALNKKKLKHLRMTGWTIIISASSGFISYMLLIFNNII